MGKPTTSDPIAMEQSMHEDKIAPITGVGSVDGSSTVSGSEETVLRISESWWLC